MSLNTQIKNAVSPVVSICEPDSYTGESTEYCTFNYFLNPDDFGDNAPGVLQAMIQLHYYCPPKANPLLTLQNLRNAIAAAGFTYPTTENATDLEQGHYVLEFYGLDEV